MEYNNETTTEFGENGTRFNNTDTSYYGLPVVISLATVLILIMIVSLAGNFMVIMTILRHKAMRTRTNMFIANLAVSDILAAVFDMPISLVTLINGDWIFGDEFCQFNGFTMALFLITSIHTLMYISIHKFVSITRPFSRFMTPKRIMFMIIGTWIWSIMYGVGAILGWNSSVYKKGATQCGPSMPDNLVKMSHSLVNTTFNFLIPLIVMSVCYFLLFREIRNHMTRMMVTSNINQRNSLMQQKRITMTLFVVMTCFLLCLTPYIIYSCTAAFSKNKQSIPAVMNPVSYWCIYLSCACNPVIYAFRSVSFRQGYLEIVCGRSVNYYSGGSFRSISQRSWSFRSSVRSTNHFQDSHILNGNVKHQRRLFQRPSTRRSSALSWQSMLFTNNHYDRRHSSDPSVRSNYTQSVRFQEQSLCGNNRYCAKGRKDNDIQNNIHEFSIIAENSCEEESSVTPYNGVDVDELKVTSPISTNENETKNHLENINENYQQEHRGSDSSIPEENTNRYAQQSCEDFNENPRERSSKKYNSDYAFYDSDVEMEDKSVKRARSKARQKRKIRSRSCMIAQKGKAVANIIDAQMQLIQLADGKTSSSKRLERAHSWTECNINPNDEETITSETTQKPAVDYLAVPQTLNAVHSEGDLVDSCKRSPLSKRFTNSFKQLFRKSQEKHIDNSAVKSNICPESSL